MRFNELLTRYRNKIGLSKTDLAKKLNVSPGYVMNLESGRRKPPTFERCYQLAKILKLTDEECKIFYKTAQNERIPEDDKKFNKFLWEESEAGIHSSQTEKISNLPPEIFEIIDDPLVFNIAKMALKNKQDVKSAIKTLLECFPSLSPQKRQAILALCK